MTFSQNKRRKLGYQRREKGLKAGIGMMTIRNDQMTCEQARALSKYGDLVFLSEWQRNLAFPPDLPLLQFDRSEFGFEMIAESEVPGGTIYAAMAFPLQCDYDYLWFVEDDVVFKGGRLAGSF